MAHLSAFGRWASSMKGASEHTDLDRVSSVAEAFSGSDTAASLLLSAVSWDGESTSKRHVRGRDAK